MTSVLIVGSGPTGLTLACDLARRGVDVRVLERDAWFPRGSRAKGPNPRSLEVLADLGVVDRVLTAGAPPPVMRTYRDGVHLADHDPSAGLAPTPDAPYAHGWLLAQWQLEAILRDRLAEHGVRVELDAEVTTLVQDDDGVTATLADGRTARASWLVGCDGGRSTVRRQLGLPMIGHGGSEQAEPERADPEQVMVLGDVDADGLDRGVWHQWFDTDGGVMMCPIPGTARSWWFQAAPERDAAGTPVAPSPAGFQRLFDRHARVPGVLLEHAAQLSTYRVNVRMVDRYRVGRVLLAGDAAHVHPIAGGLGMQTGIQDAYNLGWKLAAVAAGRAGDPLLDTYQEERLPVAEWTLGFTSERLAAVLAAIAEPGVGLEVATAGTSGLDRGYRWSSLAGQGDGVSGSGAAAGGAAGDRAAGYGAAGYGASGGGASGGGASGGGASGGGVPGNGGPVRPGDRAPDAPCRDADGAAVRLFEVFTGPRFALLGFGEQPLTEWAEIGGEWSDLVRTWPIDAGRTGLTDPDGHARRGYGITGDALVLVRPDGHVGTIGDAAAVHAWLRRAYGTG